jgi:hypothetical protein
LPAVEDFQVVILAELEGGVEVLEDGDARVGFKEAYIL